MAKHRRGLHRDFTRHSLASAIAIVAAAIALAAAGLLTGEEPTLRTAATRAIALVFGAYGPVFLWLSHLAFRDLAGDQLRARLRRSEEQRWLVRFLYVGGPKTWALTIVTIGVVSVVLLATGGTRVDLWLITTCVLGVAGTWVLLVGVFAVEHMRGWAEHDGYRFPDADGRTFGDFAYLSIQLSTTFSPADVSLTNRPARGLASVQSIVGFAYSTVIIAVFASLLITLTV